MPPRFALARRSLGAPGPTRRGLRGSCNDGSRDRSRRTQDCGRPHAAARRSPHSAESAALRPVYVPLEPAPHQAALRPAPTPLVRRRRRRRLGLEDPAPRFRARPAFSRTAGIAVRSAGAARGRRLINAASSAGEGSPAALSTLKDCQLSSMAASPPPRAKQMDHRLGCARRTAIACAPFTTHPERLRAPPSPTSVIVTCRTARSCLPLLLFVVLCSMRMLVWAPTSKLATTARQLPLAAAPIIARLRPRGAAQAGVETSEVMAGGDGRVDIADSARVWVPRGLTRVLVEAAAGRRFPS